MGKATTGTASGSLYFPSPTKDALRTLSRQNHLQNGHHGQYQKRGIRQSLEHGEARPRHNFRRCGVGRGEEKTRFLGAHVFALWINDAWVPCHPPSPFTESNNTLAQRKPQTDQPPPHVLYPPPPTVDQSLIDAREERAMEMQLELDNRRREYYLQLIQGTLSKVNNHAPRVIDSIVYLMDKQKKGYGRHTFYVNTPKPGE